MDLSFSIDVRPSIEQQCSFNIQLRVHIVQILTKYAIGFRDYATSTVLQHPPHRQIPAGYITKQYPLKVNTVDASSIAGQPKVLNNIYIEQMKMKHEDLNDWARPLFGDQHTNARVQGAKALQLEDINNFMKLKVWQLGFGLFHLCLNLIWALLHVHRRSISQLGSLPHWFVILDKARLGSQHPDYHTLLPALTQILHGIILNAWRNECGHPSLASFAESNPTPEQLLDIAQEILLKHTVPMAEVDLDDDFDDKVTDKSGTPPPNPDNDILRQNHVLLTHDLVYVIELIHAISDGDWGRIEDILGNLAMMFQGAGSNNYCAEILHFIHNLKKVWTPDFAWVIGNLAGVRITNAIL